MRWSSIACSGCKKESRRKNREKKNQSFIYPYCLTTVGMKRPKYSSKANRPALSERQPNEFKHSLKKSLESMIDYTIKIVSEE
jgi:hypothetical protein